MMKSRSVNFYDIFGVIFLTAGAGIVLRCSLFAASGDIWFDELFTVELASKPLPELISFAARDVHPPLYYILTRFVFLLLGSLTGCDIVTASKITSVIPYFLLVFYCFYFIRRKFGLLGCGLTCFCCAAMPQLVEYIIEARMYSWSAFVILAMYIHAMCVVDIIQDKPFSIHLLFTTIYGIAAMYLHYYAAVAAVWIVIFLFIRVVILMKKGERGSSRPPISLIICLCAGIAAYIPWLHNLIKQAGAVKSNYWILPLSIRSIPGCIKYIFKPGFTSEIFSVISACLLFAGCAALLILFLIKPCRGSVSDQAKENGESNIAWYLHTGISIAGLFLIPVCVTLTGMIASVIIRPVFIYRYMIPALFLLWTGYSCLLSEVLYHHPDTRMKIFSFLISALLLLCGMRDFDAFRMEEEKKSAGFDRTEDVLNAVTDVYAGENIICNFNQLQALMWYYTDCDVWLWGQTDETLIADICGASPIVMTEDTEELRDMIEASGQDSFLFFGSFNSREDIISDWESAGFKINLIYDSCLIERYYCNIYHVTLN